MLRSNSIRTKMWILKHTGTKTWENVSVKCEISESIPWFQYHASIEPSNKIEPGSEFIVSVSFYVPKPRDASSLRVPFRLEEMHGGLEFGPRLVLEGDISIGSIGRRMSPKKKYGYKLDVLKMLCRLALYVRGKKRSD